MYYPGEQQFIEDTVLIEKLALMDATLVKEAGILSSVLEGAAETIRNFAKEYIDTSSPQTILTSLANIMAPAVLFRIYKPFGILLSIASLPQFGFDAGTIIGAIKNFLNNSISQGQKPTPEQITNIGMNAVSSQISNEPDANEVTASNDMFDILKQADREGKLIKLAYSYGNRSMLSEQGSGPFLFPRQSRYGGGGILARIFGGLGRSRGKWLLGGFIVWIIKTILAGAGLLAVAGAGASLLTGKPSVKEGPTPSPAQGPAATPAAPVKPNFVWSGRGGQYHPNNNSSIWYVPMRDVNQTLLGWTIDVYPEISLRRIANLPSFRNLVNELQGLTEPGSSYIRIPSRFKTRKQIIDSFINEVSV